jgi:protein-tyrosine phosphatase
MFDAKHNHRPCHLHAGNDPDVNGGHAPVRDGPIPCLFVIDLHCHLLPAIDDGPASTAQALEMAQMAWQAGTRTMVATPHMIGRYPTTPGQVADGVGRLRAALAEADIPLQVVAGAEIALDFLPGMSHDDLAASTLGGPGRRWVLLEMPFRGWPLQLPVLLRDLEMRGLGAVIAHPERADSVQRSPHRMRDIVGLGALVQITASSLTGEHGAAAKRTAEALLRDETAHILASDAHSATWRPPGLADGLAAAAKALKSTPEDLSWMVEEGPRQVIAGLAVKPPRIGPTRKPRPDVTLQGRPSTQQSPRT